jgi:hypothetical protein
MHKMWAHIQRIHITKVIKVIITIKSHPENIRMKKEKPLTKKERDEKRKKRKEKPSKTQT